MEEAKLKQAAKRLKYEQNMLLETIDGLERHGLEDNLADSTSELSRYDNHPADLGSEMFERSKDNALRDNEHLLLSQIQEALSKIEKGTYGVCEVCGNEIGEARLEAVPWADKCIKCEEVKEVKTSNERPIEEAVLAPPFHRTFLDTADFENVGFDGEDSWQAVARWGSSDTPQDIPGSYNYKALWANSNEKQGIVDLADAIPANPEETANMRDKEDRRKRPGNN